MKAPQPQAGAGPSPFCGQASHGAGFSVAETGWQRSGPALTFATMNEANDTRHHLFDTAIGVCGLAWNARGLCGVQLPEKDHAATEQRRRGQS